MGLISLVYVSFATQDLTDQELKDILTVARQKNKQLDVTGMLLYRNGFFIQALEGEEAVVKGLYEHIRRDPRHHSITTIVTYPIEERQFADWNMGFNKMTDADIAELDGYIDFLTHPTGEFFITKPTRAKQLLYAFRGQIYF
jgi:lipopolysaccharide biosynthesis regulator YciM